MERDFLSVDDLTPEELSSLLDLSAKVKAQPGDYAARLAGRSVAMVFDNSLNGYVGPFMGRRSRIEVGQSFGSWQYTQGTFDYRRYDKVGGPFTLASRLFYFGRAGRDATVPPAEAAHERRHERPALEQDRHDRTADDDPAGQGEPAGPHAPQGR